MSGGALCLFPLAVMLVLAVRSVVAVIVPFVGTIAVAGVSLGLGDLIASAGRPFMAP